MKYLTIIQARSSSTRLPGKSLMRLNNIPLIELCSLRATNNFSELVVATSNESSDDELYNYLKSKDINVYRGSLNNVLSRFINLIELYDLDDNDVVIRLTGDNPIVDSYFLEILKEAWESGDYDYLSAEPEDIEDTNWPKGLSAEFVRAYHLKESFRNDKSEDNLEHVTKYIRNNLKNKVFGNDVTNLEFNKKHLLGIDTKEDFDRLKKIFIKANIDDKFTKIIQNIEG